MTPTTPAATATLTKWGNSQGLIIPRAICDRAGLKVGDKVDLDVTEEGSISATPSAKRFVRSRHADIATLFAGWTGPYVPPSDWPTIGNEIDWGEPVGNEVW